MSCVWNLRVFPDDAQGCQCPFVLCLHPQGCLQRGVRASGSFQERTGKLGSFSMWYPPEATSRISSGDRPHPEVRREGREPLQTKQGNRPTGRDQKGRRGSDEVLLGTSVFPSSETGMSGNFWGSIKLSNYRFALQNGMLDFSWGAPAGMGLILE